MRGEGEGEGVSEGEGVDGGGRLGFRIDLQNKHPAFYIMHTGCIITFQINTL